MQELETANRKKLYYSALKTFHVQKESTDITKIEIKGRYLLLMSSKEIRYIISTFKSTNTERHFDFMEVLINEKKSLANMLYRGAVAVTECVTGLRSGGSRGGMVEMREGKGEGEII